MSNEPRQGPTAFVLAGGGTKGSFEVGVLQYLVGVEGIAPDIITATSAGAIAATVLAQARTLPEFEDRVNEIEGDVLAWTQTEHVFGKQAWLGALDGTALGREIHQEITEGTRPPFPLTPSTVLAGNEVVPACDTGRKGRRQARKARRKRQRHLARLVAGAGLRLPRVRRQLRSSGSSVLNLEPAGRRAPPRQRGRGPGRRPRRSSPARACSCAWPSPPCAPASCATSPRTAPSWSPTPAPRRRRSPPARSTSSTAPSPRPACPWSSRRIRWPTTTTSTAG